MTYVASGNYMQDADEGISEYRRPMPPTMYEQDNHEGQVIDKMRGAYAMNDPSAYYVLGAEEKAEDGAEIIQIGGKTLDKELEVKEPVLMQAMN